MTVFEGIVALGVVAIPAWSAWSARKAATAALVAAQKLEKASAANNATVAAAASTVATVAKEATAKVEAKLATLATAEQLDGGLDKMLARIREQIAEAREKGFVQGQQSALNEGLVRIEATLVAQDVETARKKEGDSK